MNFNLVSKNNVGIVGTLILAIFLSQSRSMDFLFRTALGRLILIVLILAMSYTNKILGVVGVLFIIVMFSSSNINFMEGLDNMDATTPDAVTDALTDALTTTTTDTITTDTTTTDTPSTTTPATTAGATAKKAKQVVGTPIDESQTGVTEDTTTTTTTEDITTEDAGDNINTTENAGVESFDIIGLERNIQKGKNSNSIPINNNNYDDNVLPTDFINKLGFSLF
jgi:cytoskeletal protein RodZ